MSWTNDDTTLPDILLFNKYPYNAECTDISIAPYINISTQTIIPHTSNRNNKKQFGKASTPIFERITCQLMRRGRNSGKKNLACKIVESACDIIFLITGENPLQVLVNAIVNAGPREDCARIGRGGNMKRTSVDLAPMTRVNVAIRNLAKGARNQAINSIKTMPEVLAEELVNAARNSQNSYAVKKKDELERAAKSNR